MESWDVVCMWHGCESSEARGKSGRLSNAPSKKKEKKKKMPVTYSSGPVNSLHGKRNFAGRIEVVEPWGGDDPGSSG